MKETSREAYRSITIEGITARQKREIVHCLRIYQNNGPMTASEIGRHLKISAHKRLREMANNDGLIRECEPRRCNITGKRAITWSLLD